jgi:acetyl-CoA carboxylase carboxyl transferase subunit beta
MQRKDCPVRAHKELFGIIGKILSKNRVTTMKFGEIFSKIRRQQSAPAEAPSHWVKCQSCQSLMYYKEIEYQFNVCPKCGFHMRISAQKRIELLSDENSFQEFDSNLYPIDPLKFVDKKSYKKRIQEAQDKTGRHSCIISGECTIESVSVQLVVFDFSFMGGSLGSVEGEKIVRAINRALEKRQGLVIVSASGGARMQESTFSLLQMSKTSAALKRLAKAKLPYISVLTDPTMGGVSASFAWLGDVIMAEPGALIGFAGQRVIKQTIGADLPEGFQRSEFLLDHGLIDMIVIRHEMKKTIADMLRFMTPLAAAPTPSEEEAFEFKLKEPAV